MKLKNCCLAFSVKIGSKQLTYLDSAFYEIELYDNNRIRVKDRTTGEVKWTTLNNVSCYEEFAEPEVISAKEIRQEENIECLEIEIPKRRRGRPARNSEKIETDIL